LQLVQVARFFTGVEVFFEHLIIHTRPMMHIAMKTVCFIIQK